MDFSEWSNRKKKKWDEAHKSAQEAKKKKANTGKKTTETKPTFSDWSNKKNGVPDDIAPVKTNASASPILQYHMSHGANIANVPHTKESQFQESGNNFFEAYNRESDLRRSTNAEIRNNRLKRYASSPMGNIAPLYMDKIAPLPLKDTADKKKDAAKDKETEQTEVTQEGKILPSTDSRDKYQQMLRLNNEENFRRRYGGYGLLDKSNKKEEETEDKKPSASEEKERTWFQKSAAYDDGYQMWDFSKAVGGTVVDVAENITEGILGIGENALDAAMYMGAKPFEGTSAGERIFVKDGKPQTYFDWQMDLIKKDLVNEEKIAQAIVLGSDKNSVLGEKTDSVVQSGGQLLGTAALQAVGVPWFLTTGVTAFGGEVETALNEGASYGEAGASAAINAGAEILTEKLSGGIKFGGKTLDDVLLNSLTDKIANKAVKTMVNLGVDAVGEGAEEVVSSVLGKFGDALYKEESLDELLTNEAAFDEYLESFIGGAVLGGIGGASQAIRGGKGIELTEDEQKVVGFEVERRIGDKALTDKEKNTIRSEVVRDLQRGYISTDTIEEVLGGEAYETYKHTAASEAALRDEYNALYKMKNGEKSDEQIDRQAELKKQLDDLKTNSKLPSMKEQLSGNVMELVKGSRLAESYNERGRRGQAFQADVSKYDAKQQATIQKAIDSGILNNTNRTHEFVDLVARISADKGVSFDFTNNERLKTSGFALDGKTVNGYVTKDGVTLNIDSAKSLNSVVGHEITHVLEGTELYKELQTAVAEYAKKIGEYDTRLANLTNLYKNVKGADVSKELTADLVGDYLFTDAEFVRNLLQHRGAFRKVYDEIKYLCKVATAGSAEARKLEAVKKAFEDAYRATNNAKAQSDAKYSIVNKNIKERVGNRQDLEYNGKRGEDYARTDEFRSLQAESQRMSDEDTQLYWSGSKQIDDGLRGRFSRSVKRIFLESGNNGSGNAKGLLNLTAKNNTFKIYEGVNPSVFHDVFETARKYLKYGELVDLHGVETTEDGIGYNDCYNYLSEDGLSGFSITPDGDLISVFNASGKRGFLRAIAPVVKEKAKTLDCYASENQNLMAMYSALFGFKTASVMDYNMEFDHDNIAENHNHPRVAFMVNTENVVETRVFTEDEYDEAVAYRNSFVSKAKPTVKVDYSLSDSDPDIRFSLSAETDNAYLDAVNRGDTESAQRIFDEVAQKAMPDSKIKTEDGKLRKVYHGTNTGDFTVFNPDYIGMSSGDDGFFGMGFYFAYSKGEASYYGARRIIPAYLDVRNPFNFDRELQTYNGKRATGGYAPDAVALMNFANKFPEIAKDITVGVVEKGSDTVEDIPLAEFAKSFADVIDNKQFDYQELTNEYGEKETLVVADSKTVEYEYGGQKHSYRDYGFKKRFLGEANELDVAYEYLANAVYEYVDIPSRTQLILDNNREFTAALKAMGYDGAVQSEYGDEAVAFYPNQIKSAEPVTYDENGDVIPLSERFNPNNSDIRYSMTPEDERFEPVSNSDVFGKDISLEAATVRDDIAPVIETVAENATVAPVGETVSKMETVAETDLFPDDLAPVEQELDRLVQEQEALEEQLQEMVDSGDFTDEAWEITNAKWQEVTDKIEELDSKVQSAQAIDAPIKAADQSVPAKGGNVSVTDNARSKVLTTEPKADKKKPKGWNLFKDNFVDRGTVFETMSLKSGNPELQAKFKAIGRAEGSAQWFMEHGNAETKSLKSIMDTVEKSGKTQEFYEYLHHLHNVDRMSLAERYPFMGNKAVFDDSVTAEISKAEAAKIEKSNPEFKTWAKDVYKYNTVLREMMVKSGIISKKTADRWAKMYPHYVPIRRNVAEEPVVQIRKDGKKTVVGAPVKKATGGNQEILPLFGSMALQTERIFKAAARNRFGVELRNMIGTPVEVDDVTVDDAIDILDSQDSLLQEGKNGANPTFTVFENGERVTFEITEEMYDTMKPKGKGMVYTNKVVNKVNDIRRGLLTEYNPAFMLTNPIKDMQDVLMNSQHPAKTYANFPKAISELWNKNGRYYREYMEYGGEQNTYFDRETKTFAEEKSGLSKVIGFPLEKISQVNNFIERIPRMAEYIASRKAGRSIDVSMLDAARVTTDFSAGGDVVKVLNRNGFTFLNASVQGAVQQVRNIREAKAQGLKGWAKLAGKTIAAGLPAVLLNHLLWDDDEDYAELSDYVKENYYIVAKYGDGKFVRIPKGRTLAVIQNAFEQMGNLITGNDEADFEAFAELVISNLAPNNPLENNLIAPIMQAWNNTTWYGDDLVPSRLQDLPAAEQYDETTDSISKWLGENLNISPYKINYVLDQYSGAVGDMFLPMMTPEAERGNDSWGADLIAPISDKFTTDSVLKNQNVSDFYSKKDELTVKANASGATDEDVLSSKYMNSVNAELSKLYAAKREIQNSDDMSDSEKYEAVRDIQKQIVDLTKEGLATYDDITFDDAYREGGRYASVGENVYKLNKDGEWEKLNDEQVTKYRVTKAAGDAPYADDGETYYRWYKPEGKEASWHKLTDDQVTKYLATRDADGIYATNGTEHYRLNEGGDPDNISDWTKLSAKEVKRMNEVTKGLGITPEEYWSKTEKSMFPTYEGEYEYAYDYPENYAVAKAVGGYDAYKGYTADLYNIKADKDENGKSISGSRKEKVLDYINGLDADYNTKIILWKSEYPSDDTYNDEIIDYINGRDDLTFEEKVAALRKIGFDVTDDGDISW